MGALHKYPISIVYAFYSLVYNSWLGQSVSLTFIAFHSMDFSELSALRIFRAGEGRESLPYFVFFSSADALSFQ